MTWYWILKFFLVIISAGWLYKKWKQLGRIPSPVVPGPKGHWLIGYTGFFSGKAESHTTNILAIREQFPTEKVVDVSSCILKMYLVQDVELIKEMTSDRFADFVNHPMPVDSDKILSNKGLIGIKDTEWTQRRKLLSPHFVATKLSPMIESIFAKHALKIVKRLEEATKANPEGWTPVNMHGHFTNLTMDIIGDAGFGTEFDSQDNPDNHLSKSVKLWMDSSQNIGPAIFLPFWDRLPTKAIKEFIYGQKLLTKILGDVITARKADPSLARPDLLQSLIELETDGKIQRIETIGEALLFLVAGHETTSSALTWITYVLTKYPQVEQKLFDEIEQELNGGLPSKENIHQLKYLDCIVNETLRLYPPSLMTSRENNKNCEVGGHMFPKESAFLIPIWTTHRDPKYWEDPEKFDPDRWLPENKHKINQYAYLPFGVGPRMCIGSKFSLMETKVVVALLYQRFKFAYTEEKEPVVKGNGLYRPEGLVLQVQRRA